MAGTATVTTTVIITGGNAGTVNEQNSFSNTSANEQVTSQALSNGSTTINVPTLPVQATGVVIIPPTTNTFIITLKGVAGDTGVPISRTAATTIPFDSTPPASFVLTSTGVVNMQFRWI